MFARNVSMRLKSSSVPDFTRTYENEVLPGNDRFQDELTLVIPGGTEVVGISMWEQKENAETYERGTYQQVLKALSKVVEGTPRVQTYEVCNSTFHKIAAHAS
jgi:hypothetical protein